MQKANKQLSLLAKTKNILVMKKYNLIFLNTGALLLSSKEYNSWREIQDEYENYSASIDFESLEAIKEYIISDYKVEKKTVEHLLNTFINTNKGVMTIDLNEFD